MGLLNYFKIKKLKKLKLNPYYKECKKSYQKLNDDGKKEFANFSIYKDKWQWYNDVYNWKRKQFIVSDLRGGIIGFYESARWYGYHTIDYNSWLYMATQMEWDKWVAQYQFKS